MTVPGLSGSRADSKQFVLAGVLTRVAGTTVDSWNSFNVELANKMILFNEVVCKDGQWLLNCGWNEECMFLGTRLPAVQEHS